MMPEERRLSDVERDVKSLQAQLAELAHSIDKLEDRRMNDRDVLIEIRESQESMVKAMRDSVSNVHQRIDALAEEKTLAKGIEQGRSEQRAIMFKWIAGIVGLIAIVGYLGRVDASSHSKQEFTTQDRRYIITREVPR